MKNRFLLALGIAALAFGAVSCSDDDADIPAFHQATVTFRPQADGSFFLMCDDTLAFVVSNVDRYPFTDGKEKRALISFNMDGTAAPEVMNLPQSVKEVWKIRLNSIDTIYTKAPVKYSLFTKYPKDPVGVYLGDKVFPTTLVEDGYLNLCFNFHSNGAVHEVNLVYGINPLDPYEVFISHDAKGPIAGPVSYPYIMSFPLKNLPDTHGRTVKLTLKWNSIVSGEIESTTFDYRTRTDW